MSKTQIGHTRSADSSDEAEREPPPPTPVNAKAPDLATTSVADLLAALHVRPEAGLTGAEVELRRKEHGYNEVAERHPHSFLLFIRKFWGLSAWMLELIMLLSLALRKYSGWRTMNWSSGELDATKTPTEPAPKGRPRRAPAVVPVAPALVVPSGSRIVISSDGAIRSG